jgi:hypothetical protein
MRLTMTFVVRDEDIKPEPFRRVLTGPAYGFTRASFLFGLMDLSVNLVRGTMPIERLIAGLSRAREELKRDDCRMVSEAAPFDITRADLTKMVDSLTTWSTAGRIKGADHVAWREDF